MRRVSLYLVVGAGFLLLWLRQESGWREPIRNDEPVIVLSFTALLLGLAGCLLLWGGERHVVASRVAAGTGLLAAVANILEDGLGLEWAFVAFLLGTLGLLITQAALAVLALRQPFGRARAAVPALSCVALALYPLVGGPLMACAWGTAAWRGRRTW